MSHVTTIKTEIRDLDALRAACSELGLDFMQGQRTYRWYGRVMGDYPLPDGITPEQLGHCEHAIRVPGAGYEIGVVKTARGYTLMFDFWGPGAAIVKTLGQGLGQLVQMYGVEKTLREAQRAGLRAVRQTQADGSIRLVLQR